MAGAQADPAKWNLPGWRIEQRFSNNTLIGNWNEERKVFLRNRYKHTSTQRTDFTSYPDHRPDDVSRKNHFLRNDGLNKEHLFNHHGKRYNNCLISWYDEQYNHRLREEGDKLPALRRWDSHKLAWVPEKSDYPMLGTPTNFGLKAKAEARWAKQLKAMREGSYVTDYRSGYIQYAKNAFPHRFSSTPKHLSSNCNPITNINKDLWLRRAPLNMGPEHPPTLSPPFSV